MSYNSKYKGTEVEELLDSIGNKVDKVDGKQLSAEDFTTLLKQKLEGLSNYDDTDIQESVLRLRTDLDTLVSGDTTTAIKTFNEVIAFLDGLEDTEVLASIIASIEQQIASKQDKITDLEIIRSGAAKGATAIQDVSGKQDKNLYFTNKIASSWVTDSTYDGYAYRCDVSCSGVTADYFAEVIFSPSDATSGNYAPVCETLANVVRIYSKTNDSITIPTIIIYK